MSKGLIGSVVSAIVIFATIICGIACMERVPAGYVGVVYNMSGGVDGEILTQGWHIVSPTKNVTNYSIGIEQSYLTADDKGDSERDESFNIPTADGKTVKVDLEFSYKFNEEVVSKTFVTFKGRSGEEIKNTFIKPKIVAWTQEVSANYPVTDIFGDKRTAINAELDTYLKDKFRPYGIIIDTVNFTNISVDAETEKAIQKKVNAQQELELAKIESETALIQANKDREVALIQAEKEKQVAEIEAEKVLISANAQAEANKVIADSLTEEFIEKLQIEKWNGAYPTVVGSDSTIIKNIG